jgi:hypothetical protein
MNTKAQVGDTLVWSVSFIIIFVIMLLFVLGVSFLFKDRGDRIVEIKQLGISDYYNYNVKFATDFYNQNKDRINNWADDSRVISREEFLGGNANPDVKKSYDALAESYVSFSNSYNFNDSYFYIRTNDKEMLIVKNPNGKFNQWTLQNPTNNQFFHNFQINPLVPDNLKRVYFTSDDGKLIMIIFYDKLAEKKINGLTN